MSRSDKRGRERCPHRPVSLVRQVSRVIMGTVPLITCKNYGAAKNPGVIIGTVPMITVHRTPDNAPQNAPRDCCQARRASKQGKQKANNTHRRAAAGGERSTTTSLHPRRPSLNQASLPNGSPGSGAAAPVIFGYFPSLESTSPAGETPPVPTKRQKNSGSESLRNFLRSFCSYRL